MCRTVDKSPAGFRAYRRKRNLIVFSGGVYVGKNTLREAKRELFVGKGEAFADDFI